MNWLSKYLYEPNLLVPLRKPVGLVEIDWDNALTKGLVGCWIFDKGSGSAVPGLVRNLAKRTSDLQTISTGTGISTYQTSYGQAVSNDATNRGYYIPDLTDADFPDDSATLIEFLQTSNVQQGYHQLSSVGSRPHYVYDGSNYNQAFRYGRISAVIDTALVQNPHFHSIVQDFSNDSYRSFNKLPGAKEKLLLSATSGSAWSIGSPILMYSDGWYFPNGPLGRYWFCYIWNRALGSSEREVIYRSPYVILKPANNATFLFLVSGVTAALTEDIANESDITAGGNEIVLTLTGDTWVTAGATFDAQRQNIIDGFDSAQAEAAGWDAVVKTNEVVTAVVRTSDTIVTITLSAHATYDITATETITATIPASALVTSASPVVATPTFTIVPVTAAGGPPASSLSLMGVGI